MMAGNPSWWSINGMHTKSQLIYGASNSQLSSGLSHSDLHHPTQDLPVRSWSQLLLGGLGGGEDERFGASLFQQQKKMEKWEDQVLNLNPSFSTTSATEDVKQESTTQIYSDHALDDDEFQSNSWPRHHHQVSSPTSCITTLSNTIFNFSATSPAAAVTQRKNHYQDHSSECNSTSTGGVTKKARVQQSVQPALKVRKEKLGDRITALHQLVSPFGKTDTASVLSEAIGYIRFLQSQIEALSSPYMSNGGAGNTVHHQHSVQERNCLFPEEHSQFLNGIAIEGRGASKQDSQGRSGVKDLRSRGLCLVPISCTEHVANQNGADYWAPAAFGGGF